MFNEKIMYRIFIIFVINFIIIDGKTLQLEHLLNSPSAGGDMDFVKANATNAMNLTCTEFDSSCQWHNLKDSSVSLKWFQSAAYLDPAFFRIATGASSVPTGNYAVAASDDPTNFNASATLMSDVVKCPMGTNGFSFMYWLSPKVKLTVCLKSITRVYPNYDFCNELNTTMSPGPLRVVIPPLQNDSFQIFITASNFVSNTGDFQGGFAIIDNLNFVLESCLSPSSVASTPGIIPSLTSANPANGLTGGTTTIRMGGSSGATSAPVASGASGATSAPVASGASGATSAPALSGSTGGGAAMMMTTPASMSGATNGSGGTVTLAGTGGPSNVTVMISGGSGATVAAGGAGTTVASAVGSGNGSAATGMAAGGTGATMPSAAVGGTGATSPKPMVTGSTAAMSGVTGASVANTAKPFELNSTVPIPTFPTLAIGLLPTTTAPPAATGGTTTMRVVTGSTVAASAVTGGSGAPPTGMTGMPTGMMSGGNTTGMMAGVTPTGMMPTGTAMPSGTTTMKPATVMPSGSSVSGVTGAVGTTMPSSGVSSGASMANPSGSSAAAGGSAAMTSPAMPQPTTGPWPTVVLNSMSPLPMNLPTFAAAATTARPVTSSGGSGAPMGTTVASGSSGTLPPITLSGGVVGSMGTTMASGSGATGAMASGSAGTGAAVMGTTTPRPANSSMTTPNVTLVSRETGAVSLPPTPGKVLELNSTAPWPTLPTVAVTAAISPAAAGSNSTSGSMGSAGTTMVAPTGMISTNSTGMGASGTMPTTMKPATVSVMSGGITIAGVTGMGMSGTTMGLPALSGADHTKACAALVCTFDPTSPCINDLMGTVWKTSSTMVGNGTLSVSPEIAGNTFAYVTGPLRWSRLLLDPFELDKTVNFVFNFKFALQATSAAKLFVYAKRNDSLIETSLVTPEQPKGDLGWRNTSAILLVGAYEYVAFEVKNLGMSEIIAIDTTKLTPIFDVEYCPASTTTSSASGASVPSASSASASGAVVVPSASSSSASGSAAVSGAAVVPSTATNSTITG